MLQSMGSHRVRPDLATDQQQVSEIPTKADSMVFEVLWYPTPDRVSTGSPPGEAGPSELGEPELVCWFHHFLACSETEGKWTVS